MSILSIFLANLPALIQAGGILGTYVADMIAAFKQSGEWTPEAEAAYQAQLTNANTAPESKTDAEKAAGQ